jgi:NAD-dependent SIR2 family protein deacetylase
VWRDRNVFLHRTDDLSLNTASAARATIPQFDALVDLLRGRKVVVLTGAGCSTESGIPDYGGLASKRRSRTIQYQAFMSDAAVRKQYWARSMVGWPHVSGAQPNEAHVALARLERAGAVTGIITQNVDGLHHRADSQTVVELHGSLGRLRCMGCNRSEARTGFQERLLAHNSEFTGWNATTAPDGDAEVTDEQLQSFRVPACQACGGVLKPDVVLFGETVPKRRVDDAWALYKEGEALLVVGSSLAVFSGYRFALRAAKDGRPVAIVNVGPTRADQQATVKVEESAAVVLVSLRSRDDLS